MAPEIRPAMTREDSEMFSSPGLRNCSEICIASQARERTAIAATSVRAHASTARSNAPSASAAAQDLRHTLRYSPTRREANTSCRWMAGQKPLYSAIGPSVAAMCFAMPSMPSRDTPAEVPCDPASADFRSNCSRTFAVSIGKVVTCNSEQGMRFGMTSRYENSDPASDKVVTHQRVLCCSPPLYKRRLQHIGNRPTTEVASQSATTLLGIAAIISLNSQ